MQAFGGIILLGLVLLIAPLVAPDYIPSNAGYVMMILGVVLLVISTTAMVFARLYRKPLASEAYVRTGLGAAKVILDGERELGETPLSMCEVPIGEHTYTVIKERYEPAEKTITVEENFRYKFTHELTLRPSTLIVYSYPTGAQIRLNNQQQAETTP